DRGAFCDNVPLNPLKNPLTPQDRFFQEVIACFSQTLFNCKKCFEYFLNKMRKKIIVLSAFLKNKVKIF
ncbi:hypothetical protein HMPREF1428_00714, partial [Helicobacter pylori GAM83T]